MRKITLLLSALIIALVVTACSKDNITTETAAPVTTESSTIQTSINHTDITINEFVIDEVLQSQSGDEIHYSYYVPDGYDGSELYALFLTLPGWEGLYFQGVAENLKQEAFAYEAVKYNSKMIVVAPQLNDWGDNSAEQTIELVEYFKGQYSIGSIYANGYSGGGETLSLIMDKRPELFKRVLHVSSKWDGELLPLVRSQVPVYAVIGESDEYYGSDPIKNTADEIKTLCDSENLPSNFTLEIKDRAYFEAQGISNQHGGGLSIAYDKAIMSWLFEQ